MDPGLIAIILVCAAALPRPDCTTDSATDMLRGWEARTPIDCAMSGQALIAQSALGSGLGKDQYLKIVCLPRDRLAGIERLHRADSGGLSAATLEAYKAP